MNNGNNGSNRRLVVVGFVLSTAAVITAVAGGLVWLDRRTRRSSEKALGEGLEREAMAAGAQDEIELTLLQVRRSMGRLEIGITTLIDLISKVVQQVDGSDPRNGRD